MYLSWKFISILKTSDIFFTLFKLFTVFQMTLYIYNTRLLIIYNKKVAKLKKTNTIKSRLDEQKTYYKM